MRVKIELLAVLLIAAGVCCAQQAGAVGEPLVVQTVSLAKGFLRQPYQFQLEAEGGIRPLNWQVTGGVLPTGLKLKSDGLISGTPKETGTFRFRGTVTDSGKPPGERSAEIVLQIVAPLVLEWSLYPRITGQKVECGLRVSNQTGQDFDFTLIVLAVDEIGRTVAVGYQHLTLKSNTLNLEIPFEENLTRGSYEVNADAVGEAPATNTIYRARLVTRERLQVQQGP